jgi:aminodeoxyfutalosine deaminase
MSYRKFKADSLFDGYHLLTNEQVLIVDEQGVVMDIAKLEDAGEGIENLNGILSPGLVNCHCHLELSHLKDVIPPHTGLIEFLCSVVQKRGASKTPDFDPEVFKMQCIENAENEMFDGGIVAVGDIGNTADTLGVKKNSKIYWHNFIEVLSFTDEKAIHQFNHYKDVAKELEEGLQANGLPHRTSIVPHAPYSISPQTFELINKATPGQIISIHNQEHPAENDLYKTGQGEYLKFFDIFGIKQSPFPVTGKNSIQSILPHFNNGQTIFLIHNTCMTEEDIVFANEYAAANNLKLVYCLCINANLYIENKVPPIDLFIKHGCNIVLGTDSYSSNWQLSICKEMQSIKKHFPAYSDETILRWASSSGAEALQWNGKLGSFEKGKQPGIVLIENDFSSSRRIL